MINLDKKVKSSKKRLTNINDIDILMVRVENVDIKIWIISILALFIV